MGAGNAGDLRTYVGSNQEEAQMVVSLETLGLHFSY